VLEVAGVTLRAVHTPGHCSDHLALQVAQTGVVLTGDHVLGRGTTVVAWPDGDMAAYFASLERLAKLDRNTMAAFYKERFSNAADFTFFMVGAFKVDEALPLIARYIGSLPSKGTATTKAKDIGFKFPAAIEKATVEKGREPKVSTRISFFADPPVDPAEITRLTTATDVLDLTLREVLREQLGETYGVGVDFQQETFQRGGGHVFIQFTGAPENHQKMTDRVLAEVQRLQKEGPTEDFLNRVKQTALRENEEGVKQNGYWLSRLQGAKLLGLDPVVHFLEREKRIQSVTPAQVKEMFVKYFPLTRYTVVSLVPEPTK